MSDDFNENEATALAAAEAEHAQVMAAQREAQGDEPRADLIDRLESETTELATRDDVTPDNLCLLFTMIGAAKRRLKDAEEQLEEFCLTWMPANHVKELRIGDEVKYPGEKSREKCRNIAAAVTALYEATGGDFEAFCDCLSSNAIKYGAAKKALGDKYRDHFETIIEMDLITQKPKKILKSVNEAFTR